MHTFNEKDLSDKLEKQENNHIEAMTNQKEKYLNQLKQLQEEIQMLRNQWSNEKKILVDKINEQYQMHTLLT